jgi:hypothetical protein
MKAMNVASASSASINLKQNPDYSTDSTAQTKMLRDSMDEQTQVAQKLIQEIPQSQTVMNPSYLGRNIDTRA